ncbi:DUF397 domain-containing protein [Micromonospora peucetia]|uniref:DUF397 domain-containing protein n=1 Tax=Micromonospora peucetia TaxID=47871 RepID=A0A1C6W2V3_9ACTN|nr:DUF397 domain-containing protein [Micromonospora peucetia]MCX4391267.1 DUF397 domain-containing protein [Micromonospora peucetia]SCL72919.1 protein of unknown function (DUF397) [Micromonospora peucetia]
MTDLSGARWRKSTRSGDNGGDCVEVADNLPGIVAVRDSKDEDGAVLTFPPTAWIRFVTVASVGFAHNGR